MENFSFVRGALFADDELPQCVVSVGAFTQAFYFYRAILLALAVLRPVLGAFVLQPHPKPIKVGIDTTFYVGEFSTPMRLAN
jgi:hypothetical protein